MNGIAKHCNFSSFSRFSSIFAELVKRNRILSCSPLFKLVLLAGNRFMAKNSYNTDRKASTYHIQISQRNNRLQLLSNLSFYDPLKYQVNTRWHVFLKQSVQLLSLLVTPTTVIPLLPVGVVTQVFGVYVHHTTTWHRSGWSVTKICNLGKQSKTCNCGYLSIILYKYSPRIPRHTRFHTIHWLYIWIS